MVLCILWSLVFKSNVVGFENFDTVLSLGSLSIGFGRLCSRASWISTVKCSESDRLYLDGYYNQARRLTTLNWLTYLF
jgi:hypothetical protein